MLDPARYSRIDERLAELGHELVGPYVNHNGDYWEYVFIEGCGGIRPQVSDTIREIRASALIHFAYSRFLMERGWVERFRPAASNDFGDFEADWKWDNSLTPKCAIHPDRLSALFAAMEVELGMKGEGK